MINTEFDHRWIKFCFRNFRNFVVNFKQLQKKENVIDQELMQVLLTGERYYIKM